MMPMIAGYGWRQHFAHSGTKQTDVAADYRVTELIARSIICESCAR
jgi:hypothetical protein